MILASDELAKYKFVRANILLLRQVLQSCGIIRVIDVEPEVLLLLEKVVDVDGRQKLRVQIVSDDFSLAYLYQSLALNEPHYNKRIRQRVHIHIWQIRAFKGEAYFLFERIVRQRSV